MMTSFGGLTTLETLHPTRVVAGAALYSCWPRFTPPIILDTPQTFPFRSPERVPVPAGASKVSQNITGVVPSCIPHPLAVGGGPDETVREALQLAVAPPLLPAQLQVHGPLPLTGEAVPTEHRLLVGAPVNDCPLTAPQSPLVAVPAVVDSA